MHARGDSQVDHINQAGLELFLPFWGGFVAGQVRHLKYKKRRKKMEEGKDKRKTFSSHDRQPDTMQANYLKTLGYTYVQKPIRWISLTSNFFGGYI